MTRLLQKQGHKHLLLLRLTIHSTWIKLDTDSNFPDNISVLNIASGCVGTTNASDPSVDCPAKSTTSSGTVDKIYLNSPLLGEWCQSEFSHAETLFIACVEN
jgi:hypothetical protein